MIKGQEASRTRRRAPASFPNEAVTGSEAPTKIVVSYKVLSYGTQERLHVFESNDYPGLNSADTELKAAFDEIGNAVSAYMAVLTGQMLAYEPGVSFAEFKKRISAVSDGSFDDSRSARQITVKVKELAKA
jgi:hypothetical protein